MIKKVSPLQISLSANISAIDVVIKGKSFLRPRKLYLSASNEMMFDDIRCFNPFISGTNTQKLSYPPFRGIMVTDFTVLDDKFLIFNFPQQPKTIGYVDVIMENEAGYGKLTKDTILPYFSSFNCSQNIQFPWINGIEITYYKYRWNDFLIWVDEYTWEENEYYDFFWRDSLFWFDRYKWNDLY